MSDKPYIITYSNHLHFNGRLLAFRKKFLFDLTTGVPELIPINYHNGRFWNVKGKQLRPEVAEEITVMKEVSVDVSNLQWYKQEELNGCFNLEKL